MLRCFAVMEGHGSCFLSLLSYVADYLEQCLIAGCRERCAHPVQAVHQCELYLTFCYVLKTAYRKKRTSSPDPYPRSQHQITIRIRIHVAKVSHHDLLIIKYWSLSSPIVLLFCDSTVPSSDLIVLYSHCSYLLFPKYGNSLFSTLHKIFEYFYSKIH